MTTAAYANISQVTSQLWIGGDLETRNPTLAAVQLEELDTLGITQILDVRLEWNDEDWVAHAIEPVKALRIVIA